MSAGRRNRAAALCRRLTEDVARVVPPGVGYRPDAWEVVEEPSRRFLDLLNAWESTGDPALRAEIREAYDSVVEAWQVAGAHEPTRRAA